VLNDRRTHDAIRDSLGQSRRGRVRDDTRDARDEPFRVLHALWGKVNGVGAVA
jgi:hypothetical protein